MRVVYRLFSVKMEAEAGDTSARPTFRCEFAQPERGWQEAVMVKQSGAGSPVLQVLWGVCPEAELERMILDSWEPGDEVPGYVEVQPGMMTTIEGAEAIFQQGGVAYDV